MTQYAAGSDAGKKRDHNEDSFLARPELGLWLVADGVGGHSHGEVASAIVRKTIAAGIEAGGSLPDAVLDAHEEVLAAIDDDMSHAGMGSTVVALHLRGLEYDVVWVGDSRAYLWDGELKQLSRDHNTVTELLRRGVLTQEEAEQHPGRHVLNQSLGITEAMELQPGHLQGTLSPGDMILLCSDGLTDEVREPRISQILQRDGQPQERVDALIAAALEAGGRDNVTVVLVQAGEEAAGVETSGVETSGVDTSGVDTSGVDTSAGDEQPAAAGRGGLPGWLLVGAVVVGLLAWWLLRGA